jgi:hypothetical protein
MRRGARGARSHSIVAWRHRGATPSPGIIVTATLKRYHRDDRRGAAARLAWLDLEVKMTAVLGWRQVVVGVLSTMTMDLLSVIALRLRLTAPIAPHLMGRWFAWMARGQMLHADVAQAPAVGHEMGIALPIHYTIGVVLASIFLWVTSELGWPRSFGVSLAFGLLTNVLPWLLMFPAMGYGFFGVHGPAGTRLFTSSLISHACYGLGLWLGVRIIRL